MKIQKKLFFIFGAGIFLFVFTGILSNYFFLEKYYMYKVRQEFLAMSQKVERKMETEGGHVETYITEYGKKKNVRILVLGSNLKIETMSYYQREDHTNIPYHKIRKLVKEKKDKKYISKVFERKKAEVSKLFFLMETEDGRYILFMKNSNGVKESVAVANEFYIMIGGWILIIGLGITAVFSKKLTQPIRKMSEVTASMAELEFREKIKEKGSDEICQLAHSINKMSEKLCKSIEIMQKDISRRKQLVRDLSHELKTPVAVIKGYAEGMYYGLAEEPPEREKYCGIIAAECDRIDQMVKELLELSKLEQIVMLPQIESIELYGFIENLLLKYENEIEKKKGNVFIHGMRSDRVSADRKLLEHILDNLLENAVKYVEESGEIVISFMENEQETCLEIFNSGTKIPHDKIDKIWDVFYKLDVSRKREQGSYGIGLSIVKAAVELHSGTVFARNEENGVVFGCRFPKENRSQRMP